MNMIQLALPTSAAFGLLALSITATKSGAQSSDNLKATSGTINTAIGSDVKPTIILVHGAWADGSSWRHVIPLLERDGYKVIAVQNQLASLADDIANTKRTIDSQKGPVVVAAHSYGGAVMTGAAAGAKNVKALVYIAAFAPDANESLADGGAKFPETRIGHSVAPDVGGYLYIEKANFRDVFCKDVTDEDADVMFAAQKPFNSTIFGATLPIPAWKTIPSWFLVSALDQTINPDLERFYAKRMNAHTSEVQSSHVSLVSHPAEVTKMIEDAAASIKM